MFSVDLPRGGNDVTDPLPDVVRIVASNDAHRVADDAVGASNDDRRLAEHAVLLERPLPFGTAVGEQPGTTSLWQVTTDPAGADGRRLVRITTRDGRTLVQMWLTGSEPCTLNVEVASSREANVEAWGLGQCFARTEARADWIGRRRSVVDANVNDKYRPYGHGTQYYEEGTEGYIQIPVLMVAGKPQPFALVFDYVFRIEADFQTNPWFFRLGSDVGGNATFPVRVYVVGGATPLDVRRRVMDLLGKPPVPPRKAFGLWVSEYGFENWQDVDDVICRLRGNRYPLDGIVLDLFWFGGIAQTGKSTSEMGSLAWDITDDPGDDPFFPDPKGKLKEYADEKHIGFALIEESYVLDTTPTFCKLRKDVPGGYVKVGPAVLRFYKQWLGEGAAMLDWSDEKVGPWIHKERRKRHMVDYGVRVHWTDLGEPEIFHPDATYHGHDLDGDGSLRTRHADIANVYNLFWHRSIDAGYNDTGDADQRRLLLTRSATAGMQRYGSAVWSGDTSSRMEVLVSQVHNQAHMSCSGIDFYGSDVGGFHRDKLRDVRLLDELYTQWFANSAWFDVPLRPHVNNYNFYVNRSEKTPDGPPRNPVAPSEVGHTASNLANLRTRYELIPYYYSVAHEAARTGTPLCPPPGLVYDDEPPLVGTAHQKLLGPFLMVAVVAAHGEYARQVYLPEGRWYDFWNGTAVDSKGEAGKGQWVGFVPAYRDGRFRLPTFARGGAIIPLMHVDEGTLDAYGHRDGGGRFEDLILRVYDGGVDGAESSFTVFEDGGTSRGQVPREIHVKHRREPGAVVVEVGAAVAVDGLANVRPLRVELVSDQTVTDVKVDGDSLLPRGEASRTEAGWADDADHRVVRACKPDAAVDRAHVVRFTTAGPAPATSSVLLVCDHADTAQGEDVYARFVTPVRTRHGLLTEVKMDPSVTYAYLYPPPPGHPTGPVWTLLLDHLEPNQEIRFTFEKRRGPVVLHANPSHVFSSCGPGGYAGEIRGNL